MWGGVEQTIQSLADFLIDETCHACRRPVEATARLALPRAAASAALAVPLRVGVSMIGVDTRPLCRACCHGLMAATQPIIIGATCADGAIELVSGGRVPAVTTVPSRRSSSLVVWPAFETDERILSMIHALKFSRRERLAAWLARAMAAGLPARALESGDSVLMPIPMDRASLRRRGFNQAERLARALATHTGATVVDDALEKTRATAPQSSLGGAERVRNVAGAMAVRTRARCEGRTIVLIDDLVTTGATAAACATALWGAGARDVRVACVGYRL